MQDKENKTSAKSKTMEEIWKTQLSIWKSAVILTVRETETET